MTTVQTQPVSLSLSTLVSLLLRRRAFILASSLGAALLLFFVSLLLPTTFKATALVMPPDHSSSSALAMLGSASGASSAISSSALAGLGIKNPSDLYVALMLSPRVEDAVIAQFDLATIYHQQRHSLVRKDLESNTQILADSKSGIISVSVVDKNPERAAAIANGIVQAFEKFSSQLAITDAGRRRLFFDRQVTETKENLSRAEDALKNTSSKSGMLEPEGTARAMITYEAQTRAEIAAKTVELQSMQVYLSDDNPQVQIAQRELQELRRQADALGQRDSTYSKTEQSSASLDYVRALREVKINETLYELLLKNLEFAKLDEAREGNVIQIVSPATTPDLKDGPHRSFFLAGGFLLGFVLSTIWVIMKWAGVQFALQPVQM